MQGDTERPDDSVAGFRLSDRRDQNTALLRGIVYSSRAGVVFGIVGTLLTAFVLFVYGTLAVIHELWTVVSEHWPGTDGAKQLAVVAVEVTDLFLLGTVLNIVALGLFQLFIDPTTSAHLPTWMRVTSLDQLKSKLVGVIIVLLAVSFLSKVVQKTIQEDILELGVAIGLVILALSLVSSGFDRKISKLAKPDQPQD